MFTHIAYGSTTYLIIRDSKGSTALFADMPISEFSHLIRAVLDRVIYG